MIYVRSGGWYDDISAPPHCHFVTFRYLAALVRFRPPSSGITHDLAPGWPQEICNQVARLVSTRNSSSSSSRLSGCLIRDRKWTELWYGGGWLAPSLVPRSNGSWLMVRVLCCLYCYDEALYTWYIVLSLCLPLYNNVPRELRRRSLVNMPGKKKKTEGNCTDICSPDISIFGGRFGTEIRVVYMCRLGTEICVVYVCRWAQRDLCTCSVSRHARRAHILCAPLRMNTCVRTSLN